jgi:hypothetical protein
MVPPGVEKGMDGGMEGEGKCVLSVSGHRRASACERRRGRRDTRESCGVCLLSRFVLCAARTDEGQTGCLPRASCSLSRCSPGRLRRYTGIEGTFRRLKGVLNVPELGCSYEFDRCCDGRDTRVGVQATMGGKEARCGLTGEGGGGREHQARDGIRQYGVLGITTVQMLFAQKAGGGVCRKRWTMSRGEG